MKKIILTIITLFILIGCQNNKYPNNFTEYLPFGLKYYISKDQVLLTLDSLNNGKISKINKYNNNNNTIDFRYQLKSGFKNELIIKNYFKNDSLYSISIENDSHYDKLPNKENYKRAIDFFKDQKINLNGFKKIESKSEKYIWTIDDSFESIFLNLNVFLYNYRIEFNDGIIGEMIKAKNKKISDERAKKLLEKERRKFDGTKRIIVENSSWDNSVIQVRKYLKVTLKDPKSYEGIGWSKVIETDNGYRVNHKYRAKNSFGGFITENKIFYLDYKGNVLKVE